MKDQPLNDLPAPRVRNNARDKLMDVAIGIFADKGFAKASTREICQAAGVNAASIHYHFGDKAGLYRAVLRKPIDEVVAQLASFDDPTVGLEESVRHFVGAMLTPWRDDDRHAKVMRLHLREMVDPTPDYKAMVAQVVVPHHLALVHMLARHVGTPVADDGIRQLAFALVAMVNDYAMSREFMEVMAPSLVSGPGARDKVLERLVGYALALVRHEQALRA